MSKQGQPLQSHHATGAVPIRNEKGEISMQKVRIQRYVTGKAPEYVNENIDEDSDDDEIEKRRNKLAPLPSRKEKTNTGIVFSSRPSTSRMKDFPDDMADDDDGEDSMEMSEDDENDDKNEIDEQIYSDPRMRRIMQNRNNIQNDRRKGGEENSSSRSRRHHDGDDDENMRRHRQREIIDFETVDVNSDNDDDNVEERHEMLKRKLDRMNIEAFGDQRHSMNDHDDSDDEDEEDDDEEDEEDDESEDEFAPRLKPVFVSKTDRITILEKEAEEERRIEMEEVEKKLKAQERRREAVKLVEDERKREEEEETIAKAQPVLYHEKACIKAIQTVLTDDEDEETSYELWKVRELTRLKRDKEERDAREKEKEEIERLRNMTEEERLAELEKNPKVITNKQEKGTFKYMQKYYHRGAFYLDEEDEVFKRNFAQPTLEDHFDKSSLPSVMQVKKFGLSGRTKYTHLTDQDTTAFDQGWGDKKNDIAKTYFNKHAGGVKQIFERPSKRRKT